MDNKPIYVTQPHLPPLDEFLPSLREIWERRVLTNGGPFHQEFEEALSNFLGIKHLALVTNGTIALVTALQALRITGEVITTPYSFVATSHALLWNGIKPVFADIDPNTLNLDPAKIEAAITPQTTAILAVHCYGQPCDAQAIQKIGDNYNLKVIYDSAHAFGVEDADGSILRHGDLSVLSFHATKVFNTFEGGAIICPDARTKLHINHLKNFGFVDEVTVVAPGINGKMSEFNAALGLLQLKHLNTALTRRMEIDHIYRTSLKDAPGITPLGHIPLKKSNYSYFPILIGDEYPLRRDDLYQKLVSNNIYARRYFYPLISNFPMYRNIPSANPINLPVATKAAEQILCLPIHPALDPEDQERVIRLICEI